MTEPEPDAYREAMSQFATGLAVVAAPARDAEPPGPLLHHAGRYRRLRA